MLALTTTGDDDLLRVTELPDPAPGATEVLVRVETTSLNRGEVSRAKSATGGSAGRLGCRRHRRVRRARRGRSAGRDQVVGLVDNRAWAELVAVPVDYLTAVPEGVTPAQAACMPLAGMTAFRALALGGFPVGKSVLDHRCFRRRGAPGRPTGAGRADDRDRFDPQPRDERRRRGRLLPRGSRHPGRAGAVRPHPRRSRRRGAHPMSRCRRAARHGCLLRIDTHGARRRSARAGSALTSARRCARC